MKKIIFLFILFIFSGVSNASDTPSALIDTANPLELGTYEMILSPTYLFKPSSVYLSTEFRFQALEELRLGARFGTGEIGYHFGVTGEWLFMKEGEHPVSLGVYGSILFNRASDITFFNVCGAPMASHLFKLGFGSLTPYVALPITPSFSLSGNGTTQLAMRGALGMQFQFRQLNNMRVTGELGLNLTNSGNMFSLALAYPFEGF